MPAYFYHLLFDFLPTSHTSPFALESAREALLPFGVRPSSSSPSGAGCHSPSGGKASKELTLEHRPRHAAANESALPLYRPSFETSTDSTKRTTEFTDPRSGAILIECIDMVPPDDSSQPRAPKRGHAPAPEDNFVTAGIGTDILGGLRTKGRYTPLDQKVNGSACGVVHLFRDAQDTPYLTSNDDDYPTHLKGSAAAAPRHAAEQASQSSGAMSMKHSRGRGSVDSAAYPFPVTVSSDQGIEENCTTLCILAVPSYLSPSDFLGFVGEKTLDDVSHFRMIRTPRANRYMVLMKFRGGRKAMEWQREWNGKVFNSMEVSFFPPLFTLFYFVCFSLFSLNLENMCANFYSRKPAMWFS